jgi:hypothetical protein
LDGCANSAAAGGFWGGKTQERLAAWMGAPSWVNAVRIERFSGKIILSLDQFGIAKRSEA